MNRRDFQTTAKSCLVKIQGKLAIDQVPLTLKKLMRLYGNENVEIAGRSASRTGLTFAAKTNTDPVFNPGGNIDAQFSLACHATLSVAVRARIGNNLTTPLALRTGALDREEPLLRSDPA